MTVSLQKIEITERGDTRDVSYQFQVGTEQYKVRDSNRDGAIDTAFDQNGFQLTEEEQKHLIGEKAVAEMAKVIQELKPQLTSQYAKVMYSLDEALTHSNSSVRLLSRGGVCKLPDFHQGGHCLFEGDTKLATVLDVGDNADNINVAFTLSGVWVHVNRSGVAPLFADL